MGSKYLKIGNTYRLTKNSKDYVHPQIDNYDNLRYITHIDGAPDIAPRMGITTFSSITCIDGSKRVPLIILLSSKNNSSPNYNPWHDEIYPERGIIKYFGDNKVGLTEKDSKNKVLTEQILINEKANKADRLIDSIPVLCFEKVSAGYHIFQGFGIVENAELVTQYDETENEYFANYLFEICIFSMAKENETFNWEWIKDRYDPTLTNQQTLKNAPESWKNWINNGKTKLHICRRNIYINNIVSKESQIPLAGSETANTLDKIYDYYSKSSARKFDFEFLALEVTRIVIEENGAKCTPGWVTQGSGDGGIDYVLKINIGTERLSNLNIGVLGQAKCEIISGNVSGKDIARVVARLPRGWVGAFVTTQHFSERVQKEVLEDQFPLLLINGKKLAEVVEREFVQSGYKTLDKYFQSITDTYKRLNKKPSDILL